MKCLSLALAGAVVACASVSAFAEQPRGHVHRLAYEVAVDAQRSVDAAVNLYASQRSSLVIPPISLSFAPRNEHEIHQLLNSLGQTRGQVEAALNLVNVRVNEVLALKSIVDVKTAAEQFRAALDAEPIYSQRPTLSRQAFARLEQENRQMMENPVLRQAESLYLPLLEDLRRTEHTIRELARFYETAERVGYRMAEVLLISNHLDRQLDQVVALARSDERGNWREGQLVERLTHLANEAKNFTLECERLGGQNRSVDIRLELWGQFDNLKRRFRHLQELTWQRRHLFPENVRVAFEQADRTFEELTYAFERQ